MNRKGLAAALIAVTAALPAAAACSSAPSYPHAWCGPLITQLHATQTQSALEAALARLQQSGAPVGKLAADTAAYGKDEAEAGSTGTGSFAAAAAAPKALGKVMADLKQVNAACGQPAGAYKTDRV